MATEKKRSLLTESPSVEDLSTYHQFQKNAGITKKELITDAVKQTESSRDKALLNAHDALVNAFGPKIDQMLKNECEAPKQQLTEDTTTVITMDELESMLLEMGLEFADDDMVKECRQRLEEAKTAPPTDKERMYKDIHRKFWAYVQSLPNKTIAPTSTLSDTDKAVKNYISGGRNNMLKWISHEGSMIVCSLIAVSLNNAAWVSMGQLPEGDREIINTMGGPLHGGFWASFDQYKNFECSAATKGDPKNFNFTLGNRVASIPPDEAGRAHDVKVERKGKDIVIGDKIKLERNKINTLVNQPDPTNNGANRGGFVPRPKVSGRNAYEIRADVLEMALDWAKTHGDNKLDTNDVLDIAESFYSFVEHK